MQSLVIFRRVSWCESHHETCQRDRIGDWHRHREHDPDESVLTVPVHQVGRGGCAAAVRSWGRCCWPFWWPGVLNRRLVPGEVPDQARRLEPCLHLGSSTRRPVPVVRVYQDRLRDHGQSQLAARRHVGQLLGVNRAMLRTGSRPRGGLCVRPARARRIRQTIRPNCGGWVKKSPSCGGRGATVGDRVPGVKQGGQAGLVQRAGSPC